MQESNRVNNIVMNKNVSLKAFNSWIIKLGYFYAGFVHETSSEMQKQSGDKDLRTIQIHYLGREGKPHPIYMNNSSYFVPHVVFFPKFISDMVLKFRDPLCA